MKLRVAGAQVEVRASIPDNARMLLRAIEFASAEHADALLTPEGSLSGYTPEFDVAEMSRALAEVTTAAKKARVGLALGTCCVEDDGKCYNEIRFYDPRGTFLGYHSKILRCGSMEAQPQGEVKAYAAAPLRSFEMCGVRIGGLICNDLWANPQCTPMSDIHLTQQHAAAGVKVIFHAVNGGRDESAWSRDVVRPFHESNLRMRAAAGGLWIVTVDNCYPPGLPTSAPSGVIDPRGQWAVRAPDRGEHFFACTVEL